MDWAGGGVGWIVTSWRALQAKCSHLDHSAVSGDEELITSTRRAAAVSGVTRLPYVSGLIAAYFLSRHGQRSSYARSATPQEADLGLSSARDTSTVVSRM